MVKENVGSFPPGKVVQRKKKIMESFIVVSVNKVQGYLISKHLSFATGGDDGGAEIIKENEEEKGEGLLHCYLNLEQSKTVLRT